MLFINLDSSYSSSIYAKLKVLRDFCLVNFYVLQFFIANDHRITIHRPATMPYISFDTENHRIFIFKSNNQYVSFNFPYNYKKGKWYSMSNGKSFSNMSITPVICSQIITLLNKWKFPFNLSDIIEFDAYMDPGDNRNDWEYSVFVLQSRILTEAGYVRHDHDKNASIGRQLIHPRHHYDINYNEFSKLKIGKLRMDSHLEYEQFFNAAKDKSFLIFLPDKEKEIRRYFNRGISKNIKSRKTKFQKRK